jgi:hypothetical protein
LYLAIANNYFRLLEDAKAHTALTSAATSLAAAYQREHSLRTQCIAWLSTTATTHWLGIFAFLWVIIREIWKRIITPYGLPVLVTRLNDERISAILGVPLPEKKTILPGAQLPHTAK